MECHACGVEVVEGQKFCQECGASLRNVTDATQQLGQTPPPGAAGIGGAAGAATDAPAGSDAPADDATGPNPVVASVESDAAGATDASGPDASGPDPTAAPMGSDATVVIPADDSWAPGAAAATGDGGSAESWAPGAAAPTGDGGSAATEAAAGTADDPTATRPAGDPEPTPLGDLPTQEIDPRPPLPDPTWAPGGDAPDADTAAAPSGAGDKTLADLAATPPPAGTAGGPLSTGDFAVDAHITDEVAVVGGATATSVLPATAGYTTDEFPAVFDGSGDVHHFPPAREPFKLRLMFVLGFFGAVATLMSSAADVTDIRTSTPIDGIDTGITTLADIGVNLPIAGYIGGAIMALGGLFACYGFRWGAGIAGGAGLAVAGWAGLAIGLAEVPIAVAESITRTTTSTQFTLTVTRDLGFWLIVASGAIGLLVFAASLRLAGTGGHRSLNPWVAAVGAVGALILAAGPLIPVGNDASFSDNFRSPDALIDLPTAYFGGRLGQLALIAVAGVVGFLLVRAWGLGLVFGGISVGTWMWVSALLEVEKDTGAGDEPLGIAAGNFGANDTIPHGVTTVGMAVTLTMLLIASIIGVVLWRRERRY